MWAQSGWVKLYSVVHVFLTLLFVLGNGLFLPKDFMYIVSANFYFCLSHIKCRDTRLQRMQ